MRHRSLAKVFGRRPEPRKALFRGLATALLESERIETTLQKAKELRRVVEPLVTLAKRGDLHARRQAAGFLYRPEVVKKLFADVAQRFKTRQGGYTRIYRVGRRRGDDHDRVRLERFQRPVVVCVAGFGRNAELIAGLGKSPLVDVNQPRKL